MTKRKRPEDKIKSGAPYGSGSTYTVKKADEILSRLAKGEMLASICRDPGMPAISTVREDWPIAHPDFGLKFARARRDGMEVLEWEALDVIENPVALEETSVEQIDQESRRKGVAPTKLLTRRAMKKGQQVAYAKARSEIRLKLLARLDPEKYGDKAPARTGGEAGDGVAAPQASATTTRIVVEGGLPQPGAETADDEAMAMHIDPFAEEAG